MPSFQLCRARGQGRREADYAQHVEGQQREQVKVEGRVESGVVSPPPM
jgi:hypothetical protein